MRHHLPPNDKTALDTTVRGEGDPRLDRSHGVRSVPSRVCGPSIVHMIVPMTLARWVIGWTPHRSRRSGRALAGSPPALRGLHRDQRAPAALHNARPRSGPQQAVEQAPRQSVGDAESEDAEGCKLVDGRQGPAHASAHFDCFGHDRSPCAASAPRAQRQCDVAESGSPRRFGVAAAEAPACRRLSGSGWDRTCRELMPRERYIRCGVGGQIDSRVQRFNPSRRPTSTPAASNLNYRLFT